MIHRFPPNRVSNGPNEALNEGSFIVGYQVVRHAHLPRKSGLESQGAAQWNPFYQHDLATRNF